MSEENRKITKRRFLLGVGGLATGSALLESNNGEDSDDAVMSDLDPEDFEVYVRDHEDNDTVKIGWRYTGGHEEGNRVDPKLEDVEVFLSGQGDFWKKVYDNSLELRHNVYETEVEGNENSTYLVRADFEGTRTYIAELEGTNDTARLEEYAENSSTPD